MPGRRSCWSRTHESGAAAVAGLAKCKAALGSGACKKYRDMMRHVALAAVIAAQLLCTVSSAAVPARPSGMWAIRVCVGLLWPHSSHFVTRCQRMRQGNIATAARCRLSTRASHLIDRDRDILWGAAEGITFPRPRTRGVQQPRISLFHIPLPSPPRVFSSHWAGRFANMRLRGGSASGDPVDTVIKANSKLEKQV